MINGIVRILIFDFQISESYGLLFSMVERFVSYIIYRNSMVQPLFRQNIQTSPPPQSARIPEVLCVVRVRTHHAAHLHR
jgi:hypothetical protein